MGEVSDGVIQRLSVLEEEGWTLVYSDGSAKQVKGWWQAGYGAWFEEGCERNVGSPVYALMSKRVREKTVVVLDSKYVFKRITEWSQKWHRHGWRVNSREIGHRDLWESSSSLWQEAGALVWFVWTPLHMTVKGNVEADALAEFGRPQHPNNNKRRSEEPAAMAQLWVDVGLSNALRHVLISGV